MTYDGPIIDVHHHMWDYSMGRHTWLGTPVSSLAIVGDSRYLERNYLPTDYAADAAGQHVVATVHVEAHWDRARDSVEETQWLDTLLRPESIATRYIAYMGLGQPGFEDRLARHLRSPRVIGVRESIREHTDAAFGYAGSANWRDPVWQSHVEQLAQQGLVLELLIYPHQADAVCTLAKRFPSLAIVINHSASPIEKGTPARARFAEGLQRMAACPNVYLKLSNYFRYTDDLSFEAALEAIARPCVDAFGLRAMFASDFPVASRWASYGDIVKALKQLLAERPAAAQRAFFHDTANQVYRVGRA